ncbi:WxL domain-containing protein [Weissella confusa]|uniref:WxL domain-containing protein n=1 Tax=Weissella confusa TaxID=1583 RepID=UPI0035A3C894
MIKQALFGATVLAGLVGVAGVAHAADDTNVYPTGFQKGEQSDIATNQGKTQIEFTGDQSTQFNNAGGTAFVNPNKDATVQTAQDAKGKQAFGLTLLQVPDFNFGSQKLDGITSATDGYTTDGLKAYANADNDLVNSKPVDGGIVVRDLRGGSAGYQVYAAASNLYSDNGAVLPVDSIGLKVAGQNATSTDAKDAILGTDGFATVYKALNSTTTGAAQTDRSAGTKQDDDLVGRVAGYGNLVLTGDEDTNGTYTSGATSLNLKLANNKVKATAYKGFVTFTLQDTELTKPAATNAK